MNIPNTLSILRILLIPLVIIFIIFEFNYHYYFAVGLYLLAMVSDLLDGYIARKYHMETKLGRFLDPLADKMMNILVLITLVSLQIFPLWIVLLHIARDLVVDAVINLQASLKMFNSAIIGAKFRTLFLVIAISLSIIAMQLNNEILATSAYYLLILSLILGFIGMLKPTITIGRKILNKWEG